MPVISCPICIAHIGVPADTPAGTLLECPACQGKFPAPPPPKKVVKEKPATEVGGRSDYVDASDFTEGGGKKPKKPKAERPISGAVTVALVLGSTVVATVMVGVFLYGKLWRKGDPMFAIKKPAEKKVVLAEAAPQQPDQPEVVERPPDNPLADAGPPLEQPAAKPQPAPVTTPADADWDSLGGVWEYTAHVPGSTGDAVPVRLVFRPADRTATIEIAKFEKDEYYVRPELTVTGPATVGKTADGEYILTVRGSAGDKSLRMVREAKPPALRVKLTDGGKGEFVFTPK